MPTRRTLAAGIGAGVALWLAARRHAGAADSAVTAIDILLEPDATMLRHAEAANARLLKVYPQGFSLDATHRPHITMVQRFVRTAALERVYAAAGAVIVSETPTRWSLRATGYYYIPDRENGLAGIVIAPTDDLLRLQQRLVEAIAPYAVETGTSAAFATDPGDAAVVPGLIEYVAAFVAKGTGRNFNPHVTIGVAPAAYLKAMVAERFEAFSFAPAGAAVFQLGDYGTARKRLHAW